MLPDPDWKGEDQPGVTARTSGGKKDKDSNDDAGGDITAWMFDKKSKQKTEKSAPKKRDSKKKPVQPKENDDCTRRNVGSKRTPLKRSVLRDQL